MTKKQKKMLKRIILSGILLIAIAISPAKGLLRFALYMIPYLIIGHDILKKAFKGIINRRIFDENFLMATATIGAIAIALIDKTGDYTEAVAVMLFYQIGELFQSYAVGQSRKNISQLMDIRPDYANVLEDDQLVQVDPEEVEIGTVILVQPGEKVPIDGIVVEGCSTLNTSALTGESVPKDVEAGDEIISGCINLSGVISVKTTKEFGESTVSKILDLVENASSRKSKKEDFISRFARIYTPAVCISALALAILPPVVRIFAMDLPAEWSDWAYRALTFLVISCPCALVISIPLSFFAGIGGASKEGVLIKGSNYMESLAKATCVVFDKTGTLTQGVFEVNEIHYNKMSEEELLEYAALAEISSPHPISLSLQKAAGKKLDRSRVENIKEFSGKGVMALVDGKEVAVGNEKLMEQVGVSFKLCHSMGTIIHVAIDGEYQGHIVITDKIKDTSKEAISNLKKCKVRKTVMLTGDENGPADHVARCLGVDEFYCKLLPQDKVDKVEMLLEKQQDGSLVFVGDGINDAPVLSRADIGIAMGAMGSDAAIEAADIVIMDDDPLKVSKAIKIARKCIKIVYENIWFAIGVKFLCLGLGALGLANMWLAIFADVGVMIIAILNAIRAMFVKKI